MPAASSDLLRKTEQFLHDRIPLTMAMGVGLESFDASGLVLTAPLGPNHNHLGTAFGGSLAAAATLAGYTLLWLELDQWESHIVIQESHLRYLAPVREDIRAIAPIPGPASLQTFRDDFRRKGKARIQLAITIVSENKTCVEFSGTFVALSPARTPCPA